jgi:hypothetical protein
MGAVERDTQDAGGGARSDDPRCSKGIGVTPKIPLLCEPGGFGVLGHDRARRAGRIPYRQTWQKGNLPADALRSVTNGCRDPEKNPGNGRNGGRAVVLRSRID